MPKHAATKCYSLKYSVITNIERVLARSRLGYFFNKGDRMAKFDVLFTSSTLRTCKMRPYAVTRLDAVVMGICVPERLITLKSRCDENDLYLCTYQEVMESTLVSLFPTNTVAEGCLVSNAREIVFGDQTYGEGDITVNTLVTTLTLLELEFKNCKPAFTVADNANAKAQIEEIWLKDDGQCSAKQLSYKRLVDTYNVLHSAETIDLYVDNGTIVIGQRLDKVAMAISATTGWPLIERDVVNNLCVTAQTDHHLAADFRAYTTLTESRESLSGLRIAMEPGIGYRDVADYVHDQPLVSHMSVGDLVCYMFVNTTGSSDTAIEVMCEEVRIQLNPSRDGFDIGTEMARQLKVYYSGAFVKKQLKVTADRIGTRIMRDLGSRRKTAKSARDEIDSELRRLQDNAGALIGKLCLVEDTINALESPTYLSSIETMLNKTMSRPIQGAATVFADDRCTTVTIILLPVFVEVADACYKTNNLIVKVLLNSNNLVMIEHCGSDVFETEMINDETVVDAVNTCDFVKLVRAIRTRIATEVVTDIAGKYKGIVHNISREELLANL